VSARRAHRRLAATALASALFLTGGAARASTTDFLDLEAGVGFSSNPGLRFDGESSVFGRISASGVHQWTSEKGSTSIHGYVENTTYLRGGYGSKQNFSLGANTNQAVSETVTVYGDLNFSGDFAGQLSNRLIAVPGEPVPVDPNNPLPPTTTYPDLFGLSGRTYRASGDVGASIKTGARGVVSLTAGAQRSWFTGPNRDADYTSFFGSAGYSTQVSERTRLGASVYLQHQDFRHGDWANSINPVINFSTQLSESLRATAAIGVLVIRQRSDGDTNDSVSPSFSGSLCSDGSISRICARVARDAQSSLSSGIVNGQRGAAVNTTAAVDYFRKLGPNDTLQASLSFVRSETPAAINGDKFRSNYLSAVVGYDRHIGNRLYAGVQGGVRRLFQTGPDPKADFNASVYLRYRLGDLL
jgi:hypothetical protein